MAVKDAELYAELVVGLEDVVSSMTRTHEYEKLYKDPSTDSYNHVAGPSSQVEHVSSAAGMSEGRKRLLATLPELYAAILLFSVRSCNYFGNSGTSTSIQTPMLYTLSMSSVPLHCLHRAFF